MDLLDFLVTSKIKKDLLKWLWKDGIEASAHQFAELCDAGYATVYDELKSFFKVGLIKERRQGKANLYKRNLDFKDATLLMKLLECDLKSKEVKDLEKISAREVIAHLAQMGAPFGEYALPKLKIEKELVLVAATQTARENSTVARALPVAFALQEKEIQFEKLKFYSQKTGLQQEVGFFLELTSKLNNSSRLKKEAKLYRDRRISVSRSFFVDKNERGPFVKLLEEKNTPRVAKRWHFTMNMRLDSFSSMFRKAMAAQE